MTTTPASEGVCARCGAALTPATTYLWPTGAVCWSCFGQLQSEQERAASEAYARERSLTRRARSLGYVHGVMWGSSAILAASWVPLPSSLATALVIGSFALGGGLVMRRRWAYQLALGLDAAAVLAILVAVPLRLPFGGEWVAALGAAFPAALLALTRALRAAYRSGTDDELRPASRPLPRWLLVALGVAAAGGAAAYLATRPRPDPARELMRVALPRWQAARARAGSAAGAPEAAALVEAARPWPAVASALDALDRAWPSEPGARAAARSVNAALADARLPYFTDVWALPEGPILLSYDLYGHVPWRVGARAVDVVRVRRLDTLNIQLGLLGVTQEGQASVLLDRIEAALAVDLPAMYGKEAPHRRSLFNAFDRAALARTRAFLEARVGAGLAGAAAALGERDRLVEEMRARLHGGAVVLRLPDGFVLGKTWLAEVEPLAELTHPGGPLVLDTDLRAVAHADEALREPATAALLDGVAEALALSTEAHEARHAADADAELGPPPSALFDVLGETTTAFTGLAGGELRAYLGQLADGSAPACATLARIMRDVFGRSATTTPHHYATLVILKELVPDADAAPVAQLDALCAVPDGELRARVAAAWRKLYGEPMPPAERLAATEARTPARTP
jgi:hypothetical protein